MSKCLVGFCHSVGFFFLLHSAAGVVCSIHDFVSETKIHGLFTALASEGYEPAKAEGLRELRLVPDSLHHQRGVP